jgi:hypothetical protein
MPGRMQRASNAGIWGNGALEAGAQPCRFTARRATNGAPLRGDAAEGGVPEELRLPGSV